ncbi:hypothetical protein BDW67DRAFT_23711 [Aspergillus spinulosporus]
MNGREMRLPRPSEVSQEVSGPRRATKVPNGSGQRSRRPSVLTLLGAFRYYYPATQTWWRAAREALDLEPSMWSAVKNHTRSFVRQRYPTRLQRRFHCGSDKLIGKGPRRNYPWSTTQKPSSEEKRTVQLSRPGTLFTPKNKTDKCRTGLNDRHRQRDASDSESC